MPIYEYACKSCDHTLTRLQKMSDDALVDCPECGKPELKRLISAPRFRLKGGGWYETDFKKDNQRNISKGDSEPDKSAAGGEKKKAGDTASPDSKPDSKPDGKPDKKPDGKTDTKPATKSKQST